MSAALVENEVRPATRTGARDPGDVLAVGFGATVAMWLFSYVCLMPGLHVSGWLLSFGLLAFVLLAGWRIGRWTARGWRGGLYVGLVTGLLNLLVLASLIGGGKPNQFNSESVWYVPGAVLLTALLAAGSAAIAAGVRKRVSRETHLRTGGGMSKRVSRETALRDAIALSKSVSRETHLRGGDATDVVGGDDSAPNWRAALLTVAICATLVLLAAGGLVTGFEAGLAVPDWPSSFGYYMFLYPLTEMKGGVYFEHAHRLFGSLVGLTTLTIAAYLQFVERRGCVRALAAAAFVVVVAQGILGGLRVTGRSLALAIVHGVLAQLFFSALVALRLIVSNVWRENARPQPSAAARADRRLGAALVAALLCQLALGAFQRHAVWGLYLHIGLAVVVVSLVVMFGVRLWGFYEPWPVLGRLGVTLAALVVLQLALGVGSLFGTGGGVDGIGTEPWQVAITTAHQTMGAVLLATSVAAVLLQRRMTGPGAAA